MEFNYCPHIHAPETYFQPFLVHRSVQYKHMQPLHSLHTTYCHIYVGVCMCKPLQTDADIQETSETPLILPVNNVMIFNTFICKTI